MLGLFAGLALTCSLAAAENPPLRKVRLQLKWQHQFQFAGYYAAVEQGYYREAGLEVELIEAQPGRDPALTVMEGRAEFGVGDSDLLLLRAAGKPAVVLAAIFPHSPLLLLTRAASGVADLQGLHNREMMVIESEKAELLAYFKHEGVDVAGLRLRPHTLRTEDFIEGKVDTMSACSTDEPFELRQAGVGFPSFTARTGGIDFYGDNLYTTEEQIRRDPALVRAFRAASLRGWDYPLAKPAETIALIEQRYRSRLNHDHLEFEATQTAELMHPGIIQVGHMNPGRWQHIAGTYAEFGLLPSGFDLTGFLYDPDPRPNLRWLYWTLGILGVVTLAAIGWIMQLERFKENYSHYCGFVAGLRDEKNSVGGSAGEDRGGLRRERGDEGGSGEALQGVAGHGQEAAGAKGENRGPEATASFFRAEGAVAAGAWIEAEATHRAGTGFDLGGAEGPLGPELHGGGRPLGGDPAWADI